MNDMQITYSKNRMICIIKLLYWAFWDMIVIAKRELIRISRSPDEMLASTLVPIVFFLMFRYVFGGAISVPGNDYTSYLVPGILVLASFLGSASTGLGLCTDLERGLIDRFISLPMARSAVISGRILATLVRGILIVFIVLGFSLVIGYRIHSTIANSSVAIGLLMLAIFTFSWLFGLLALLIRNLESFSAIAPLFAMFIVYFSNAFAPTNTMPSVLRIYAENQPVSLLINSIRGLLFNQVDHLSILKTLIWFLALLVVSFLLTMKIFKNITNR